MKEGRGEGQYQGRRRRRREEEDNVSGERQVNLKEEGGRGRLHPPCLCRYRKEMHKVKENRASSRQLAWLSTALICIATAVAPLVFMADRGRERDRERTTTNY